MSSLRGRKLHAFLVLRVAGDGVVSKRDIEGRYAYTADMPREMKGLVYSEIYIYIFVRVCAYVYTHTYALYLTYTRNSARSGEILHIHTAVKPLDVRTDTETAIA